MEQGTSDKKFCDQKKRFLVILAACAVLLLVVGIWVWGRHGPSTPFDSNAVDTSRKPLTEDEMLKELQKQADESSFCFRMNTDITVVAGGADDADAPSNTYQKADWSIVNSIENTCSMQVTITGEDGTVLYESRTLEPGEQELTGELKTELEPGSYTAEAEARAIDPDSGEILGNVTAD